MNVDEIDRDQNNQFTGHFLFWTFNQTMLELQRHRLFSSISILTKDNLAPKHMWLRYNHVQMTNMGAKLHVLVQMCYTVNRKALVE